MRKRVNADETADAKKNASDKKRAAKGAISYEYFNAKKSDWRAGVERFLNEHKPAPGTVSGGFSGNYDLHIFVKNGSFKGVYNITGYNVISTPSWKEITKNLIRAGNAKVLGISSNDVLILNWSK